MSKPFDIAELFKEIDRIMADEYGMPKEVLIIDDDENTFDKVTVAFLKAGYIVYAPSESQISSEAISDNIPDLLVIKMSSRDASNDAVAGAFLKIAELADVPVVLFSPDMTAADAKWLKAFKIKADKIILSGKPYDILDAAREVLCSKRKRGG
jgi:PleD family two-component response regulator